MNARVVALGVAGVALLAFAWSTRRRWRVVRGASVVAWSRILPDAAARWAAEGARLVVLLEPSDGLGNWEQAWIVRAERTAGSDAVRAVIVGPALGTVPSVWAPAVGDAVDVATADVLGFA
jgi:hypothetical protein